MIRWQKRADHDVYKQLSKWGITRGTGECNVNLEINVNIDQYMTKEC
jgi:hypothetical protein